MAWTHRLIILVYSMAAVVAVAPIARADPPTIGDLLGSPASTFGGSGEGDLDVSATLTTAGRGSLHSWRSRPTFPPDGISSPSRSPPAARRRRESRWMPSPQFQTVGDFKADPAPKVEHSEVYANIPIETHEGRVTWRVPVRFAEGIDPAAVKINGSITAQRCLGEEKCLPPKKFKFTASAETPQRTMPRAARSIAARLQADSRLRQST